MKLLVDIGNTRVKAASFDGSNLDVWPDLETARLTDAGVWSQWLQRAAPTEIVTSNVAGADAAAALEKFAQATWNQAPRFAAVERSVLGMDTAYTDPGRLGIDRWLAALAAWRETGHAVAVIDFGTAVTLDFVTSAGRHQGGMIAPGFELMRAALTTHTADLKSETRVDVEGLAANTNDAISLGCASALRGLLHEMHERVSTFCAGETVQWWLTGGGAVDAANFVTWSNRYEPKLVLLGLAELSTSSR